MAAFLLSPAFLLLYNVFLGTHFLVNNFHINSIFRVYFCGIQSKAKRGCIFLSWLPHWPVLWISELGALALSSSLRVQMWLSSMVLLGPRGNWVYPCLCTCLLRCLKSSVLPVNLIGEKRKKREVSVCVGGSSRHLFLLSCNLLLYGTLPTSTPVQKSLEFLLLLFTCFSLPHISSVIPCPLLVKNIV